jgi:hypothetical protein
MDYNSFITKYRENKKFDEQKTKERLAEQKPAETVSSTEPAPEEQK